MKKHYTQEEVILWALKSDSYNQIKKVMKNCGVEGTEEVIKRAYNAMPTLRAYMLESYKEIINGHDMPSLP